QHLAVCEVLDGARRPRLVGQRIACQERNGGQRGDRRRARRHVTRSRPTHRLLPLHDDEFGLQPALAVGYLELDVLRADALLELERRAAPVRALVRPLPREERHELVLAGADVACEETLDAAAVERIDLAVGIEVARDVLAVELELDRVEREELADVHRDEDGYLRARREEKLLFEQKEIAVEIDGELLERLHLLVERAKLACPRSRRVVDGELRGGLARLLRRRRQREGGRGERGRDHCARAFG